MLSYCFEGTLGFDVKALFASYPVSRVIGWYNEGTLIKDYSVPRDFSWIENYKTVFVWGHYFVQYGFIKVCIFYRFVWKTIFFVFMGFLCFLLVLCWIRWHIRKVGLDTWNRWWDPRPETRDPFHGWDPGPGTHHP